MPVCYTVSEMSGKCSSIHPGICWNILVFYFFITITSAGPVPVCICPLYTNYLRPLSFLHLLSLLMFYKFYMHFLVIVQRFEHFYVIALYKLKYYYYYYYQFCAIHTADNISHQQLHDEAGCERSHPVSFFSGNSETY